MNVDKLSFKILNQEPGIDGIYKAAELPGRICYGSMDKMTNDSAKPFVERLMNSNHGAPLEHGAVYLILPEALIDDYEVFFRENPYSKITYFNDKLYVSTNLRVLFDNNMLDLLEYVIGEPTIHHEKRVMVEFTANIGVTREYNRHRHDSINEESTRYCNYSKDKYSNQINIIENYKFYDREEEFNSKLNRSFNEWIKWISNGADNFNDIDYWLFANSASEWSYMGLINKCGWKQQDARDVLLLDTKSSLIHTAFISDWCNFFNLRALGTTGAPHPQAKEIAYPLMEEFIKLGYVKIEEVDGKKYCIENK